MRRSRHLVWPCALIVCFCFAYQLGYMSRINIQNGPAQQEVSFVFTDDKAKEQKLHIKNVQHILADKLDHPFTNQISNLQLYNKSCPGTYNCLNGTTHYMSKVLIIGVTKSGTTALEWFLTLNKRIKVGVPEPHFFDWYYDQGLDWYCKMMPCATADDIVLERTPRYYVHLSQRNVYHYDPNIKLLLIVREPADRMVSHLVHNYGLKEWTFYERVVLNRTTGEVNEHAKQIYQGLYYKYWDQWTHYFKHNEQLLVLNYKDLYEDPYKVVQRVETFLGLEHTVKPEQMYFDQQKGFYCKLTDLQRNITECMGSAKGRKHPEVPHEMMAKIRDFYRPWNEMWFDAIGEDFKWNHL